MICKRNSRRALVVLGAVLSAGVLSWPASAGAALKYPDLRTVPPYDIRLSAAIVNGEHHYLVRFSNLVTNAGTGPFELHGTPHVPFDGLFDADQWIYDDTAGVSIEPVGTFAFHPSHQHFHFDNFARYELWRQRDLERAESSGFTKGKPLYASPKVSFCVLDTNRVESTAFQVAFYRTCSPVMMGISPGWGDEYGWTLDDQWVDVGHTPLPDGDYVVRSIADPENQVFESDGKADHVRESQVANSAVTYIRIVNGRLAQGS